MIKKIALTISIVALIATFRSQPARAQNGLPPTPTPLPIVSNQQQQADDLATQADNLTGAAGLAQAQAQAALANAIAAQQRATAAQAAANEARLKAQALESQQALQLAAISDQSAREAQQAGVDARAAVTQMIGQMSGALSAAANLTAQARIARADADAMRVELGRARLMQQADRETIAALSNQIDAQRRQIDAFIAPLLLSIAGGCLMAVALALAILRLRKYQTVVVEQAQPVPAPMIDQLPDEPVIVTDADLIANLEAA